MHGYANPTRFLSIARPMTPWLLAIGLIAAGGALVWGLTEVPSERLQGETVRIMFIHVPTAWLAMAGWLTIAGASLAEIVWRHPLAAIAGRAAALPGAFFTAICLVTGSLWGRPAWGRWWVWDGRLTSMLVLLFLYLAYMALAGATAREGGSSRIPAIFGLIGIVNLPVIHYSVLWFYSVHQPPSLSVGRSAMAPAFLYPLLAAAVGFTALYAAIVLMRMRALLADQQAEARLRRRAREAEVAPRASQVSA